jgi:CubicO group peptidase (beta-lactamase class C family)
MPASLGNKEIEQSRKDPMIVKIPCTTMQGVTRSTALMLALALVACGVPQPASAPLQPASTLIELRRAMLNPPVNALFFHNMDELFDVHVVERGDATSALPNHGVSPPGFEHRGRLYSYEEFAEQTYTNGFLILRNGEILFEDYRNKTRPDSRFAAFSVSKTIVALLVGIAIDEGAIRSPEDPVELYVSELVGSGYAGSSIRSVLEMRSGVDYEERYDFGANPSLAAIIHERAIVQNEERFADRAPTLKRKAAPGERFNYSTMDTAVAGWVLEQATGKPLHEFMSENLWKPAGMEFSGFWLMDGPPGVGRELSGMGFNAALRDYGRLGELLLEGGELGGRRIVSKGWIEQATSMKPLTLNEGVAVGNGGGYGYCLWRIDDNPGSYSAVGLAGQFIYVHPASHTVIVKLSYFPPGPPGELEAASIAYFEAITRWQPVTK